MEEAGGGEGAAVSWGLKGRALSGLGSTATHVTLSIQQMFLLQNIQRLDVVDGDGNNASATTIDWIWWNLPRNNPFARRHQQGQRRKARHAAQTRMAARQSA
jgi:hypothetical protein